MTIHYTFAMLLSLMFAATSLALADDDSTADTPAADLPTALPTPAPERLKAPVADTPASPAVGVLTPKLQPQSVSVLLVNGATMTGTLTDADQWTMKTSLGTTTLPLSAVAGIRMAQEGTTTTTVVLHNGDNITGAVQIDQLTLQMEWGKAEIFGTHVASILFTPGLKWSSEPGLNGTRWKLIADESRKPTAEEPLPATARPPAAATAAAAPRVAPAPTPAPPRPVAPRR